MYIASWVALFSFGRVSLLRGEAGFFFCYYFAMARTHTERRFGAKWRTVGWLGGWELWGDWKPRGFGWKMPDPSHTNDLFYYVHFAWCSVTCVVVNK